jgi:hypothetical protein
MTRETIIKLKALSLALTCAFLFLLLPAGALTQVRVQTGSMVGFVYGPDSKILVENAVAKIRNVKNGKEYKSESLSGLYKIENIEEGRYILGVSTAEGDFNFEPAIFIKANEEAKLSLTLKPGAGQGSAEKENNTKSFFISPLGIAVQISSVAGTTGVMYGAGRPGHGPISPGRPPWVPPRKPPWWPPWLPWPPGHNK